MNPGRRIEHLGERSEIPRPEDWFSIDGNGSAEAVLDHMGGLSGLDVLDIPCGSGTVCNRLLGRCGSITGVDINPAFISSLPDGVDGIVSDMRSYVRRESYDVVINWHNSFGYFDRGGDRLVLGNWHASLRKGGVLLIEGDNPDAMADMYPTEANGDMYWDAAEGVMRYTYGDLELVRRVYPRQEMQELLASAGFRSIEVYGAGFQKYSNDTERIIYRAVKI